MSQSYIGKERLEKVTSLYKPRIQAGAATPSRLNWNGILPGRNSVRIWHCLALS
jgi:hypothetical protein